MFEVNIPTFDLGNFVLEDYIFHTVRNPKNEIKTYSVVI